MRPRKGEVVFISGGGVADTCNGCLGRLVTGCRVSCLINGLVTTLSVGMKPR